MQNILSMVHGAGTTGATGLPVTAKAATGAAGATGTSASSASTGNDITSNDFLTLLVTEMKNQDPTQPTDPNAYIQQLVQVNSLQQLIGINQGITSLDTAATGSSGSSTSATTAV